MGRSSRITRTFHNKPRTDIKRSTTKIPTPQTTKHVSGSNNRSEEPQRQKYYTPSAHANLLNDDLSFAESPSEHKERTEGVVVASKKNIYKGKAKTINTKKGIKRVYKGRSKSVYVNKGRQSPPPLDQFAQGVGNNIQNIYGLVTGTDQGTKSVLNKATDQALAGDWGSAGNTIANNPYKFAGNIVGGGIALGVATNVGNVLFPVKRAYGSPERYTPKKEVLKERVKSKGERMQEYYAQKAKEDREEKVKNSLFGGYGQFL